MAGEKKNEMMEVGKGKRSRMRELISDHEVPIVFFVV
jgi:hypothetical protein